MNMDMSGAGVPWLDQPVMLHSSRLDKCKLTEAQCAFRNSRWRYWYAIPAPTVFTCSQAFSPQVRSGPCVCTEYGVFTVCGHRRVCNLQSRGELQSGMGQADQSMADNDFALAIHGLSRVLPPGTSILVSVAGGDRFGHCGRYILLWCVQFLERRPPSSDWLTQSSAAMTLGPQPYYWPTDASYGSSPPIATRTGWMALGLLPFVLCVVDNFVVACDGC